MKIKNESGYHPSNISLGDTQIKRDTSDDNTTRIVSKDKIVLYDCNEQPLVRKIGFK